MSRVLIGQQYRRNDVPVPLTDGLGRVAVTGDTATVVGFLKRARIFAPRDVRYVLDKTDDLPAVSSITSENCFKTRFEKIS